jgi:hypothetical protein
MVLCSTSQVVVDVSDDDNTGSLHWLRFGQVVFPALEQRVRNVVHAYKMEHESEVRPSLVQLHYLSSIVLQQVRWGFVQRLAFSAFSKFAKFSRARVLSSL